MTCDVIQNKLLMNKAKITTILSEDCRLYRLIPLLDECMELLEEYGGEDMNAMIFSADTFCFLGRCFEHLPFLPHAVRCYDKAFKRLVRAGGEHDLKPEGDELISKIYEKLVYLRNCIALDNGQSTPDVCPELSMLMVSYVGKERCAEHFNSALKLADSSPRICPAGHTQSYYAELYDVEQRADKRISQLDPALASTASYYKLKRELMLEKGIDWYAI